MLSSRKLVVLQHGSFNQFDEGATEQVRVETAIESEGHFIEVSAGFLHGSTNAMAEIPRTGHGAFVLGSGKAQNNCRSLGPLTPLRLRRDGAPGARSLGMTPRWDADGRGGMAAELSRPCDRRKSQGPGTAHLCLNEKTLGHPTGCRTLSGVI